MPKFAEELAASKDAVAVAREYYRICGDEMAAAYKNLVELESAHIDKVNLAADAIISGHLEEKVT